MSHGPASLVVDPVPIRLAPAPAVPVLSVPPSIPNHPIRKLLIPTDGSEVSMACLPYAVSMLDSLGGDLRWTAGPRPDEGQGGTHCPSL